MKISNKYLVFAGAALMLVSCDLDKLPEGDVTKRRKLSTNVRT